MTREEMADAIQEWADNHDVVFPPMPEIRAAVAELRKSCAGCRHWRSVSHADRFRQCVFLGVVVYAKRDQRVPLDGSGYCRPGWEAK